MAMKDGTVEPQHISQLLVADLTRERMREADRERMARQARESSQDHGTHRSAAHRRLTTLLATAGGVLHRRTPSARRSPAEPCLDARQP